MVRRKQSFSESVQLLLTGPKSILPESVLVSAPLNRSWYELLSQEVGLEVTPDSGIFLCTRTYTPSDPKDGIGWRSELNETVGQFVGKFERRKKQFCVRICQPVNLRSSQKLDEHIFSSSASSNNGTNITQNMSQNLTYVPKPSMPVPELFPIARITPGTSISLQPPANSSKYYSSTNEIPLISNANRTQIHGRGSQQKRSHGQTLNEISLSPVVTRRNTSATRILTDPLSMGPPKKRSKAQSCSVATNNGRDSIPVVDDISSVRVIESEPVDTEWDGLYGQACDPILPERTHSKSHDDVGTSDDRDRNVNRAPLACYLLTEMFKE